MVQLVDLARCVSY
ncbi:hypothetical protein Q4L13_003099 [Escherichia coli]|nr:hypothetical protein [Escherichia coli]